MNRNTSTAQNTDLYAMEKLRIRAFHSSQQLKEAIRAIIKQRGIARWDFCGLKTCGELISLCFKRSLDLAVEEPPDRSCVQCA